MKKQTLFFNNKNKKDSPKFDFADVRSAAAKSMTKPKKRTVAETTEDEEFLEDASDEVVVPTDLAKTTKLVFFRKYDTYQALLEIMPKKDLPIKDCYSKVILYIMRWFRNRLGEGVFEKYPDIAYLRSDYPMPEDYETFSIENVHNIEGLNFLDFETIYLVKRKAWFFHLAEPDNGQEKKDIQGRTFGTDICVYRGRNSVVLGIKESCREPEQNSEDASGYRPGFVRDIFYDKDLVIGEQGLDEKYIFSTKPIRLNGKAKADCEKLYTDLIMSKFRQMPILFVPGEFYREHKDEVNEKTVSLLGYCHVVVWSNTCRKLFESAMNNEELVDAAENGKLIFYRSIRKQDYLTDYFDGNEEKILSRIRSVGLHEPIRKRCDFGKFHLAPSVEDLTGEAADRDAEAVAAEENLRRAEIKELRQKVGDYERDNDRLQRENDRLSAENKKLEKDNIKIHSDFYKKDEEILDYKNKNRELAEETERFKAKLEEKEKLISAQLRAERARIIPLLNLPAFDKDKKESILSWIREYYSDVLVIHKNAERSFIADSRNLDWHKFCMMIHYLAGYTKHRNSGGVAIDAMAAREYDPEESSLMVEPTGTGQGATEIYKDKYTITIIDEDGKQKNVLMDLHIKSGKGNDVNMIRIYFYYSADLKKSIIGYMPDHLPTRKQAH